MALSLPKSIHALILGSLGSLATLAGAVPLPAPDSAGWIRLFRKDNASDFWIANVIPGAPPAAMAKKTFPNATYSRLGDTLVVTGSPAGQIYFNQSFSRYRVRYQMRFPGNTGNCGMLYHVQENDTTTYGFPPSIESQGDPNQGMGQVWPIGHVWIDVKTRNTSQGLQYDPNGQETVYGGKDWNSRMVLGKDGYAKPGYAEMSKATGWVQHEVIAYGSDSIIHLVQDTVRIKFRNPRISPGGTPDKVTKKLSSGLIGWQSEGARAWYRNLEIMLLPGDPLYASTYVRRGRDKTLARPSPRAAFRLDRGMAGWIGARGAGDGVFDARGKALGHALAGMGKAE